MTKKQGVFVRKKGHKKRGRSRAGQGQAANFPLLSSEFNVLTLIQVKCLEGKVSPI